ncbi:cobalt ECF transporter T component CbiQ [Roseospira goensis]|uniref:Cobalt/nickel transport system permease protein n=1 Tax=Roseospira goensis TaxID=391922 RepID=A0A7W6RXY8_9PROT|nr:cobalt ECF transporter T component CbiQ [Roseospira goensis]MBB4285305.1 cobalt/nickel transport system permease protein [Roseospira goensis]
MSHVLGQDGAAGGASPAALPRAPVQALDPRARILGAVAFALVTVALDSLWVLLLPLVLAGVALAASRLPVGPTLKRMAMMDGFILVLLVLLPFTVPGPAAVTLFGWPASWAGLEQAAAIALKANAIVLMLLTLVGSMEPTTLGHALARLRVPLTLVHLLLFTVRYIAVMDAEYHRLRRAMKTRGFRPGTNGHTFRSFGYLIGMLLVRAFDRGERILSAMKCRGFTGHLPLLDSLRFGARDAVFGAALAAGLGLLLTLDTLHAPPV